MSGFTPVSAAVGGALIGLATTLLMLLTGRMAGISGILAGCLDFVAEESWRIAFIAGLILAPIAGTLVGFALPSPAMPANWGVVVGAHGLLLPLFFGEACLWHDFRSRHEHRSCAPAERVKRIGVVVTFARLTHSDAGAVGLSVKGEDRAGRLDGISR